MEWLIPYKVDDDVPPAGPTIAPVEFMTDCLAHMEASAKRLCANWLPSRPSPPTQAATLQGANRTGLLRRCAAPAGAATR